MFHLGLDFQWVSRCHHQIGGFSLLDGAKLVASAPNLCRVDGNRLERLVRRKSESHRGRGLIGQISDKLVLEGAKCELNPSLVNFGRQGERLVVGFVLTTRQGEDSSQNHWYVLGFQLRRGA